MTKTSLISISNTDKPSTTYKDQSDRSVLTKKHKSEYASKDALHSTLRALQYHLYTIHLFTASDFKTIIFPQSAFGILTSLSGPLLFSSHSLVSNSQPTITAATAAARAPLVFLWVWLNLLPMVINNQRQAGSIIEDKTNKPWRPLAAGRLSVPTATRLKLAMDVVAVAVSIPFGCVGPSVGLICFGSLYNDFGGADRGYVVRNLLNSIGYVLYGVGATIVASGGATLNATAYWWFFLIFVVISSTVQSQDLADQEGDAKRGRRTLPLVIGDGPARWTIAVPMAFLSVSLPAFWRVGVMGWIAPLLLGSFVIKHTLFNRNERADALSWKLWNLWMVTLYLLPLVKKLGM